MSVFSSSACTFRSCVFFIEWQTDEFKLKQNYLNPFHPTTTLSFFIGNKSLASLNVYNLLGQEVARLFNNQDMEVGIQEVEFNGENLASGIYFYRIKAETVNEDGSHNVFGVVPFLVEIPLVKVSSC